MTTNPKPEESEQRAKTIGRVQLTALISALRELRKAYSHLARGRRNAEQQADTALARVVASLTEPHTRELLNAMVHRARGHLLDGNPPEGGADPSRVLQTELQLIQGFNLDRSERDELTELLADALSNPSEFPESTGKLTELLMSAHRQFIVRLGQARELPRKDKKATKGGIVKGVSSMVLGAGIIASNYHMPPLWAASYGIGGGALVNGFRDLFPG